MNCLTQLEHPQALTKNRFDCFVRAEGNASHSNDESLPGWYRIEVQVGNAVNLNNVSRAEKSRIASAVLWEFHDRQGIEVPEDFEISVILETGQEIMEDEGQNAPHPAIKICTHHCGKINGDDLPAVMRNRLPTEEQGGSAIQCCLKGEGAGTTQQNSAVGKVNGSSWASVAADHVDALVAGLKPFVVGGDGSVLTLYGYMPPYAIKPTGYLEFWITTPTQPEIAFSVEFGRRDAKRIGFGQLVGDLDRETLEAVARGRDPVNLRASVANFDELWKFACQLVEECGIGSIQLRYGV